MPCPLIIPGPWSKTGELISQIGQLCLQEWRQALTRSLRCSRKELHTYSRAARAAEWCQKPLQGNRETHGNTKVTSVREVKKTSAVIRPIALWALARSERLPPKASCATRSDLPTKGHLDNRLTCRDCNEQDEEDEGLHDSSEWIWTIRGQ